MALFFWDSNLLSKTKLLGLFFWSKKTSQKFLLSFKKKDERQQPHFLLTSKSVCLLFYLSYFLIMLPQNRIINNISNISLWHKIKCSPGKGSSSLLFPWSVWSVLIFGPYMYTLFKKLVQAGFDLIIFEYFDLI